MKKFSDECGVLLLTFLFLILFALVTWAYYFYSQMTPHPQLFRVVLLSGGMIFGGLIVFFLLSLESDNAQLSSENRKKKDRLDIMEAELSTADSQLGEMLESLKHLASEDVLNDLFNTILDVAQKVLRADEGSVMLLGTDETLRIAASRGLRDEVASRVHISLGDRVAGLVAKERCEFLLNGDLSAYPLFRDLEGNPLIHASIICPIEFQNEVLGVLTINRTRYRHDFTSRDLKKALILAHQAGQAIYHKRMGEILEGKAVQLRTACKDLNNARAEIFKSQKNFLFLKRKTPPAA